MGFSVSFQEVAPYPQGPGWTQSEFGWRFQAVRLLDMAWPDMPTFCREMSEYPNNCFPYSYGTPLALARQIRPQGIGRSGGNGNEITYTRAQVLVNYDTIGPIYNPGSLGDYVDEWTIVGNSGFSVYATPGRAYWASDTTKAVDPEQEIHVILGEFQYIRQFQRVLTVPAAVYSLIGYANASPVVSYRLGLVFSTGTLLYRGSQVKATANLGQLEYKTVTETFSYSDHGWNKWWRAGYGWDNIVNASTNGEPYVPSPPGNFALLG